MDLLLVFVMLAIPVGILGLYLTRAHPCSREMESLTVVNNLGNKDAPKGRGCLAWFSPTSLPIVVSDPAGSTVENVLLFEEYPLVLLRVYSTWIPPGQRIDVVVAKDGDGHVIDITIAP